MAGPALACRADGCGVRSSQDSSFRGPPGRLTKNPKADGCPPFPTTCGSGVRRLRGRRLGTPLARRAKRRHAAWSPRAPGEARSPHTQTRRLISSRHSPEVIDVHGRCRRVCMTCAGAARRTRTRRVVGRAGPACPPAVHSQSATISFASRSCRGPRAHCTRRNRSADRHRRACSCIPWRERPAAKEQAPAS